MFFSGGPERPQILVSIFRCIFVSPFRIALFPVGRTFTVQVAISFNPGLKWQWGQSAQKGKKRKCKGSRRRRREQETEDEEEEEAVSLINLAPGGAKEEFPHTQS